MWMHRHQQGYILGKRHVHLWFPTIMVAMVIHNVKGVGIAIALWESPQCCPKAGLENVDTPPERAPFQ
jgi:hypothetical protein